MSENSLSVISAGDICTKRVADQVDRAYARRILEKVQPILNDADLRLANLETPLFEGGEPIFKSGPNIIGLPKNVAFLEEGRFDCAVQANNHTGDYGTEAVLATVRLLDEHQIGHCGAGKNTDEAYLPWITEKNGIKLAVLSFCENEFGTAQANRPGAAGFEIGRAYHAIRDAKAQADFVMVVFHGGNEHNPLPSPRMKERYRLFVEFGADAVIGMHPHCPQGTEFYKGAPIVYSVGNFFFYGAYEDLHNSWYYGYLPKVTFRKGAPTELEIFPYCFRGGNSPVLPFEGAEKQLMLDYIAKISEPFKDDETHRKYFNGWCVEAGNSYASGIHYDTGYFAHPEVWEKLTSIRNTRNVFTCEAHNEMVTNLFRIIEENKVDEAKEYAEKIKELQKMPL